jgi:hypothetical protein
MRGGWSCDPRNVGGALLDTGQPASTASGPVCFCRSREELQYELKMDALLCWVEATNPVCLNGSSAEGLLCIKTPGK